MVEHAEVGAPPDRPTTAVTDTLNSNTMTRWNPYVTETYSYIC